MWTGGMHFRLEHTHIIMHLVWKKPDLGLQHIIVSVTSPLASFGMGTSLDCALRDGAEYVHQPHTEFCKRHPSCPRNKCPVGLIVCMYDARLRLALWRQQ